LEASGHPAPHRNEVEFVHFHTTIDQNDGRPVFAYCRRPLGAGGQIMVVAKSGADDDVSYILPWPRQRSWTERGTLGATPLRAAGDGTAVLSLQPFEVRVFELY
jgi:hypothetical protein